MAVRAKDKVQLGAFSLRCPQTLLEKIRLVASRHRRSMNREIEMALLEYIESYEAENGKLLETEEMEQLSLM